MGTLLHMVHLIGRLVHGDATVHLQCSKEEVWISRQPQVWISRADSINCYKCLVPEPNQQNQVPKLM